MLVGTWSVAGALTVDRVPQPLAPLAKDRATSVARGIATREPTMRARAKAQFPFDRWSQDDAFHAHEQHAVRDAAARETADLGSALDALDEYLRSHPSPFHKPGASPCKPRPFYD